MNTISEKNNTENNVIVKEVKTKSDLRKFVNFPNVLYKDVPQFVPAFYGDDLEDWNKAKNPAFEYCEGKTFLAYKNGKIVGRIGAILSHKANEKWHTQRMRFSQVDFIDDFEVSSALFKAVEDWAKEKGCNQVHGPLGFSDMDREGMLVEGFDKRNMFITYYNHPYYIKHLEKLGYKKDVDWVEYKIYAPEKGSEVAEKMHRIAERVLKRGNYHKAVVKNRFGFAPYIKKAFNLLNEAYDNAGLYGVVEFNDGQIKKYSNKFIPLLNPKYCCFVLDENEDIVALGVTAPSMAATLKKSNGRLFPFGWVGVLKAFSSSKELDMFLIAVKPELQGTGLNAVVVDHIISNAVKNGMTYAETGPQLEYNAKILTQWKTFEKEQHKRRRCFIKDI